MEETKIYMIRDDKIYISSDGTQKDVTTLDYQYLVNALAKAYRNLNETLYSNDFVKNNKNIENISNELLIRNSKRYSELLKIESMGQKWLTITTNLKNQRLFIR